MSTQNESKILAEICARLMEFREITCSSHATGLIRELKKEIEATEIRERIAGCSEQEPETASQNRPPSRWDGARMRVPDSSIENDADHPKSGWMRVPVTPK
jgi:hypothetical protein